MARDGERRQIPKERAPPESIELGEPGERLQVRDRPDVVKGLREEDPAIRQCQEGLRGAFVEGVEDVKLVPPDRGRKERALNIEVAGDRGEVERFDGEPRGQEPDVPVEALDAKVEGAGGEAGTLRVPLTNRLLAARDRPVLVHDAADEQGPE